MKIFLLALIIFTPATVFAVEYVPLAPIPGLGTQTSLEQYINAIFDLAITIGAILAILQLIRAGFTYMTSEALPDKKDARGTISAALIGLILLISVTLILNIINPNITKLDLIEINLGGLQTEVAPPPTGTGQRDTSSSRGETSNIQIDGLWESRIFETNSIEAQRYQNMCSRDGTSGYANTSNTIDDTYTQYNCSQLFVGGGSDPQIEDLRGECSRSGGKLEKTPCIRLWPPGLCDPKWYCRPGND